MKSLFNIYQFLVKTLRSHAVSGTQRLWPAKGLLLAALLGGIMAVQAFSQNATISYNGTAQPDGAFTVCGNAETNSLRISNGNSATMANTLVTLHFPPGGAYVPGTITGATESNITNLNAPVFSVPDIPASNNANITYQATFGCAVIAFQNGGGLTQETADFSYMLSGVPKTQTGTAPPSTYNVLAAALSIISFSPTSYTGNVGSSFTQTATIRNGGLGCTTSAYVKLDKAGGSVSFGSPSIGTLSNDTLYLNSAQMPGGDGKWCNGEDVTISYTVTVVNCNNLNRSVRAGWGCGGSSCQQSTAVTSNIIIANNVPNLAITIKNPNYDLCFKGELVKQSFKIVNNGAGPATNIQLTVHNSQPNSFSGHTYFDTLAVWQVRDKNGNVIGAVNHFSGTVLQSGIKNAACGTYDGITQTTGNLTGVILPPGDSLFVDVYARPNNYSCGQTCLVSVGWFGIRTKLDYKNQCGQGAYSVPFTLHISRTFTEIRPIISVPTDISGIVPNNTFSLDVFMTQLYLFTHPNGKGKIVLAMPLAGTNILPTASSVTYGSYTFPVNVANDTMFIGPLPKNVNIGGNQFKVPMQATCGTGGLKTLSLFALVQYDTTCSPVIKFACTSAPITLHCPSPCPKGGATPLLFSLKRINFGQPDNNNNGIPDASGAINLSKVEDHHSVNGDTLRGTWNIIINPNVEPTDPNFGLPFTHTYIDFQLGTAGLGAAGTLNALPNAGVTIYPTGGGAPINCTVSPTIVGTKAHYDLTSCKPVWNGGDSLVVQALYTVNEYNTYRYNTNPSSGFTLFVTNNEVYSTYVAQNVPTTAPINTVTYTCDHYNDYNQMARIWLSPYLPAGQLITGCANTLQSYTRHYTRNQEGANTFPFEYRNFFIPDVMKVMIPHGFVYRSNSAKFNTTLSILDADVIQVGDTLYFSNIKKFYTPYGGTLTPADEVETQLLTYSIDPTCSANPGIFNGATMSSGIGNGLNTPSLNYGNNFWYPNATGSGYQVYTYNAPQPNLAGGGTVVTNTGAAGWTMQLQNISNSVGASNGYFYISPVGHFTNIVVKEGATVITPDANGFYHLGNLNASASRNFTVTADLAQCSLDSMRLNFGWGCTGYPTVFTPVPCQQYTTLKASGFPAGLDMTFDKLPAGGTVDLCTPFTLETVINSTLVGNLDHETYKVFLPTGMNYISNSVQVLYPVGGSYAASAYNPTIIPSLNGDTLVFTVNNLTGGTGLTGVGDLQHNRVQIKFQVQTSCGFVSGKSIRAIVEGESVCGDPTPTVAKTSSAININGALATTQYSISVESPASFSTCGAAKTVTVTVQNTGTASPAVNDSLSINLSNGLSLVAGSVTGLHNGPSPAAPVVYGTTLRWRIPPSVAPGDHMKFTMNLQANSAGCGPNVMDLYATQSISLMCGAGSCNTPVVTGQLVSDTIITCCCPPPTPMCLGDTYTLTAPAGLMSYQWYDNGVPVPGANGQTYLVTTGGSYSYTALDMNGCGVQLYCPVDFQIITPSASVIAGNQTVCSGDNPAAFTETTAATGSGMLSYQWQSSTVDCLTGFANIAGAMGNTYDPPAGITQTTYYRVVVTNTVGAVSCKDTSNCVTVTVNPAPTANAGPDQSVCLTAGSTTLSANAPSVGTGAWSVVSGPNTASSQFSSTSANNATFTPTGGAGTYTLRWTVSNAPCPASTDDVAITVTPAPTVSAAGPDQSVCLAAGNVTLAANTPSVGTGAWSVVSGPSTASSQFNSTTANNATFTPAGGVGTYTLRWTVSNAPCAASTDDVAITFTAALAPTSAGSDQNVCITAGNVTLSANAPSVGTGAWSVVSGPSTASSQFSSTSANNATFTPTGGAGTYTLRWTVSNAPCPASTDDVAITFTASPTTANAGPDQNVCAMTPNVALAANAPAVGTGAWSVVSGPSTLASQFSGTSANNATFTPAGGVGTYTLRWTVSNAPCAASTDDVAIVFTATPTASAAGPDQNVCIAAGNVTLAANAPSAGTGAWSVVSGPSTASSQFSSTSANNATFTPTGGAGTYTLRWTVSNAPCPASTDDVAITFTASPTTANAGPDQNVCATTPNVALAANAPAVGTGAWSVVSGPSTLASQFSGTSANNATFTPAGGVGTYTLRWTVSNAPCAASTDDVVIVFTATPTASAAGPDQTACISAANVALAANALVVGTGAWSVAGGPSTLASQFSNTALRNAIFTPAGGPGVYTLRWTVSNAPCPASVDDVQVTFVAVPTATSAGPDQNGCPFNPFSLSANTPLAGTGSWSIAAGPNLSLAQFSGMASPNAIFTPATPGVYTLRWTIVNPPCTDSHDDVVLTATDAVPPVPTCVTPIVRNTDSGVCSANVALAPPSVSDNCSFPAPTVSQISGPTNGSAFPKGTSVVVWRAMDATGNSSTCSVVVTIVDVEAPMIICPANIIRPTDPGICGATIAYTAAQVTDNCPGATSSLFSGPASGATLAPGTHTVVLRASDASIPVNTAQCSFTITVVDTQSPAITCPPNQSVGINPNTCAATVTYPKPTATDNCALPAGQPTWVGGGSGTVTNPTTATATFNPGVTTVVWKATDAAGLSKTCSFRIIVSDTQAPTITCPTIAPVNAAQGTCSAVVTYANATATDNCTANPVVARIKGAASGSTFAVGTSRLIFRATDAAGRTSTCLVLVTVVDNQPPVISCPGNITATGNGIPCRAVVNYIPATGSDNCDGTLSPFQVQGLASGSVFPAGVTTNTWRARASNGQETDCSFTVTINNCPNVSSGDMESRDALTVTRQTGLRLAPNPADDRAMAVVEGVDGEGGRLLLFDVAGRLVWEQKLPPVEGDQQVELPVGAMQQGAYQVVLRTSKDTMAKPLIVVH